ncbi:sigma-70 family RNA polymerase sigma factor [Amycolatopsis rubida]|uniref:Sigma-70 family RNA polymerase sigma factor n=1 Tax=Amycolatopsis rubida TaxID=112413 RepID=A0ABX0BV96_9PSEU|nr:MULTISPECIES: sigma-70 family RNA polymerase sigma factor [Amycolatopsis]MYW94532.1 RNA polymerase subunit sigma [Amycolatopsis rubida]NEC59520.1 sigma-70 family RNA polymerase sigma factor [Amycolatopsis rubida]OAP27245.1 RNA polymerase sigma factor [Amycolatopsis sp. M39]
MTELGTAPPPAASESDEQALLKRLRDGEDAAFGELFELHAAAVRRLAQSLASDRSEAEDITAETFFRVLQALRRGAGPRDYVRAYLLTVARRVSWEWHGARRDVPVTDDELTFRAGAGVDTPARTAEHTLITTAFTSLPERWRTVLWQTEVEGEQPAMVAPHFGLSANATAALARRARQGLRAAYLQAHLSVNRGPETCRAVVEKLGGFTAGSVTGAEAERIKAHLLGCPPCRATQDELRDVCSSLRAHAGVLVLAVPALAGAGKVAGAVATVKSVVFGSKVKVGLALASTAAAGAVSLTAGPLVFGSHPVQNVGLGGGAPELALQPPEQPPPPAQQGPRVISGKLYGSARPAHAAVRPGASQHLGVAEVPHLPPVRQAASGEQSSSTSDSAGSTPRDDLPGQDGDHSESPMTSRSSSTESRSDLDTSTNSSSPSVLSTTADDPTPSYVPPPSSYVPSPDSYVPPSVTTAPRSSSSAESSGCPKSAKSSKPVEPAKSSRSAEPATSARTDSTSGNDVTGSADSSTDASSRTAKTRQTASNSQ